MQSHRTHLLPCLRAELTRDYPVSASDMCVIHTPNRFRGNGCREINCPPGGINSVVAVISTGIIIYNRESVFGWSINPNPPLELT